MQKIATTTDLKNAIQQLEYKQAKEWPLLKEQFYSTYENLTPANLIKNTLNVLTTVANFKEDLLDTTLSFAAGYLSKKAIIGTTHNPLKQLLGGILQMGITSVVSRNANGIKSAVMNLINSVLNKKNTSA